MSKEDVSTPQDAEVKEESTEEVVESTETTEETIASAIADKEEKKIPDSIPYDRFSEKVAENKELKDRLAALEKSIQENASRREVASDISDIADEFGVDEKLLERLTSRIQAQAQATIEEKLAPLTAKEKQEKQDKVLTNMLNKALESNPEYADVVDPDVIKQLALNPANADKTMSQLIEKTYGRAVKPVEKKTMETTSPGKSEVIDSVDYDRAQKDSDYFAKIKADPQLHADYNKQMIERMSRYM